MVGQAEMLKYGNQSEKKTVFSALSTRECVC